MLDEWLLGASPLWGWPWAVVISYAAIIGILVLVGRWARHKDKGHLILYLIYAFSAVLLIQELTNTNIFGAVYDYAVGGR